jgi:hypothetical protein
MGASGRGVHPHSQMGAVLKLTPKKWGEFQHYKDRKPTWIKLHCSLLVDYDFVCLPVASRALAPMLWLLASEYEGGTIDASLEKIAFRCHMTPGELGEALNPLIEAGFFTLEQDASNALADCKQDASPEKEKEKEKEERREDCPADAGGEVVSFTGGPYAFHGKLVRLKQDQLDKWRTAFPALTDIRDELSLADEYYAEHPPKDGKWFFKVYAWLQKANKDASARRKQHLRAIGDAW